VWSRNQEGDDGVSEKSCHHTQQRYISAVAFFSYLERCILHIIRSMLIHYVHINLWHNDLDGTLYRRLPTRSLSRFEVYVPYDPGCPCFKRNITFVMPVIVYHGADVESSQDPADWAMNNSVATNGKQ